MIHSEDVPVVFFFFLTLTHRQLQRTKTENTARKDFRQIFRGQQNDVTYYLFQTLNASWMHICSLYRSVNLPHCRSPTEERFTGQQVHWKQSGRSCLLEPNGMCRLLFCTVDYTLISCHNMQSPPPFLYFKIIFFNCFFTT